MRSKFYDVEQNEDEWLDLRAGKATGSKLGVIMANYGKALEPPAQKYAVNIAVERLTRRPIASTYSNEHMERGHEQEPLARMLYEETYFCNVTNGGFFESDDGKEGISPDGLVSDSGAIEIKSVIATTHYANIKRGTFDPSYKWQMIGLLRLTGRKWVDFVSYCDNFPQAKKLYTYRLYREQFEKEMRMIDFRLSEFEDFVHQSTLLINGS